MSYLLVIVGAQDNPLYEVEFGTFKSGGDGVSHFTDSSRHMNEFVVHAALDIVDQVQWATHALYLKQVDKFSNLFISAYLLPMGIRLMLLHTTRNEDAIRQFFVDVHDLYVKAVLSPFCMLHAPITSPVFDQKVKASARKYL